MHVPVPRGNSAARRLAALRYGLPPSQGEHCPRMSGQPRAREENLTLIRFFLPIIPPTVTHQEHKVMVRAGKPSFFDPPELADARQKLTAYLSAYRPQEPFSGAVRLITRWCFPAGKHQDGSYKITRPDTDNMIKLLKDCMTQLKFWKDDAQVASELTEKFWAEQPGIYIEVESI